MTDQIKQAGAGPFAVGDRVYVRPFDCDGTITEVGETHGIRAYSGGNDPGELRAVTGYTVALDNGIERGITDRDGQLARA